MKKTKFYFLLAVSGLLLKSCNKEAVNVQPPIFPLNIGNTWTYVQTTYNMGNPEIDTIKDEILYKYSIQGLKGFSMNEYIKGEPFAMFTNDNEGNSLGYFFSADTFMFKTIYIMKNARKGDKWILKTMVFTDDDKYTFDIKDFEMLCFVSDTLIETAKGKFLCNGYSYHPGGFDSENNPFHTFVLFYSINVGEIKFLHYEYDNAKPRLFRERTLIDYLIK